MGTSYTHGLYRTLFIVMLIAQPGYSSAARPDFSGLWFNGSATPFQRPIELGDKDTYSKQEAATLEAELARSTRQSHYSDPERDPPPLGAEIGQEADFLFAPDRLRLTRILGAARTSLIVSPRNGRLPYRDRGLDFFDLWRASGVSDFAGPEIRPASERCLNVVGPMAPMIPWIYNANLRIVQTNDFIMIKGEMLAPRIIALSEMRDTMGHPRWEGESQARWQNNTLVIETTNFRPEISWDYLKTSAQLHVTESFQLLSDKEIFYTYTLIDTNIYTAPVTVEMVLTRRQRGIHMYEFACHERNLSLTAILKGARVQERLQRSSALKPPQD